VAKHLRSETTTRWC